MKELSIEQKAKAYDEALKQIKECTPDENGFITIYPQEIFPEIKEIEPKFHEGDWVVDKNGTVRQILSYKDGIYKHTTGYSAKIFEDEWRIWDITKDAKDGDVLSDETTIFIFKDLLSDGSVMSYCDYDANSGESDAFCPLPMNLTCSKITPATKEQRDLLFSKMKEAGYEWDAEKKELKKIEQTIEIPFGAKDSELQEITYYIPKGFYAEIDDDKVVIKKGEKPTTWSEEDEMFVHGLIRGLAAKRDIHGHTTFSSDCIDITEAINWLNSIKGRVQPKQEWSEEDEKNINFLCELLTDLQVKSTENEIKHGTNSRSEYYYNIKKWLKSLKDKYTWKPSDEQIKALEAMLTASPQSPAITSALLELREQLKKL